MILARTLLLATAILFSLFTANAAATLGGNNGLAETIVGTPDGGGGGLVTWYQLENTGFGVNSSRGVPSGSVSTGSGRSLAYPGSDLADLRAAAARAPGQNKEKFWKRATRQVMVASCGSPVWEHQNLSKCPLWWNEKRTTGFGENKTWLNVHAVMPDPQSTADAGIEGQIAGFNIRVFREHPVRGRWDLVLQRQVGIAGQDTEPANRTNDSRKMTRYWWYGGVTDNAGGTERNGKIFGGSYSLPGRNQEVIAAGMIGNGQGSAAKNRCANNLTSGINFNGLEWRAKKRELLKRINRGRACYWEGSDMGPNSFRYRSEPGHPGSGAQALWGDISRPRSIPNDQFGPVTKACNYGVSCRGKRESFTFKWSIPTQAQAGVEQLADWSFQLRGAPGFFYAVQIIAIDSRERIVPMTHPRAYSWGSDRNLSNDTADSRQFMQVYIAAPGGEPQPGEYSTDERDYSTMIGGDGVRQTREIGDYAINLDPATDSDEADNEAPNFPRELLFQHFTPQLRFSDPDTALRAGAGPVYGANYVRYYSAGGRNLPSELTSYAESAPEDWPKPEPISRPGGNIAPNPKIVSLRQAIALNTDNPEDDSYKWAAKISWLRSTLDNPCSAGSAPIRYPYDRSRTSWPTQPNNCQIPAGKSDVFNAWDDLLAADASWDSQRVLKTINPRLPENERGMVSNQLLRCNVGDNKVEPARAKTRPEFYNLLTNPQQQATGGTNGSGPIPGPSGETARGETQYGDSDRGESDNYIYCRNTIYPLLSGSVDSSQKQKAQGVIDVQPPGSAERGSAFITLDSNRLGNLDTAGGPKLYSRDSLGRVINLPFYNRSRAVNQGQLELNFCRQGVPQRVVYNNADGQERVAQVRYRSSAGIRNVPASFRGDDNCRGYVQWFDQKTGRFGPYRSDQWSKCKTNLPGLTWEQRLRNLIELRKNEFGNMANNSSNVRYGLSGLSGDLGTGRTRAYGDSFSPRLSPFIFKAPWEIDRQDWRANENSFKDCSRQELRWNGRRWVYRWINGYSLDGQWRIHRNAQPQRGWGADNSGAPLPRGGYLIDIPFESETPTGLEELGGGPGGEVTSTGIGANCPKLWKTTKRPVTCWTLKASYEGYTNRVRVAINRRIADPAYMFVKVYGNRGIR